MRTTREVLVVAFTLIFGLSVFGVAPAADMTKQKTIVHVAKPVKSERAKTPPAGATPTTALHIDKSIKWKTDPKSHSVFAVGEHNQLWFMEPTSGWPYTVDAKGYVYTADPSTGSVYSLGKLSKWSGPAPYFFTLWDYAGGSYRVPTMNNYVTIYTDNSAPTYAYDTAYNEVWGYQDYFNSTEFAEEMVNATEETTTEETSQTTTEEHHEESTAEEHHDESAAEEHHDEPAAEEHHDEPAAEEHHDEPAAEEHHDEPAAEEHHDEADSEEHN